jgi:hypothetical protein
MMGDFVLIFFLASWIGLVITCAIRVFLKIRKIVQKQQLKKSFKLIEGGKK